MPTVSKKIRAAAALLIILMFAAPATAEQSRLTVTDGEVWLNKQVNKQVEARYSCPELDSLTLTRNSGNINASFGVSQDSGNITGAQFRNLDNLGGTGTYSLNLNCENASRSKSAEVVLKELEISEKSEGVGYFGQKMTWGEFTNPANLKLEISPGELDTQQLELISQEQNVQVSNWDSETGALELEVDSDYPPRTGDLKIKAIYGSEQRMSTILKIPVKIYPWKPSFLGDQNPGRKISYDKLGELSYRLNILHAKGFSDTLYEEDFVVTVTDLKTGETVFEEKEWVQTSDPEGEADYELTLGNVPDLDEGRYEFKFAVKHGSERAPIDTVRVVKTLKFSGQVTDSSKRGLKTKMVLKNNERTIPVITGSDGRYSTEIGGDVFESMILRFFDRQKASSDAKFTLSQVDLGVKSSVGSSEAIKFQYWENTPVTVSGLNPVNMMAVKFGHHVGGGAQASMAFNPSNINPENLKVFECTSWNFLGKSCLGTWEKVPGNDVSVNYANWRVHISNLNLHHISAETGGKEKDILMNAYLVGTNSKLGLQGENRPLKLNSPRIVSGGALKVSGTVISSQGSRVEDANVTVHLMNNSKSVKTFSALSDSAGDFQVEGEVPAKAGDYGLKVEISRDPFQSFSTVSDSTIEVYHKKGMEIQNPDDTSIELGKEEKLRFELRNTGQVPVNDISVELTELNEDFYKKISSPQSLDSGESAEVVYQVKIPESFCPYPCGRPPSFNVKASGTAKDSEVSTMTAVFTDVRQEPQENTAEETEQNSSDRNRTDEASGNSSSDTSFVSNMAGEVLGPTGAFLKRQSSLNVALGLIMIFTMILALAVKKKNSDSGRDRFGRSGGGFGGNSGFGNSSFNSRSDNARNGDFGTDLSQDFSSSENSADTPQLEDSNKRDFEPDQGSKDWSEGPTGDSPEEVESGGESGVDQDLEEAKKDDDKYVCEETGEVFDTEAALKMHKKINGLE